MPVSDGKLLENNWQVFGKMLSSSWEQERIGSSLKLGGRYVLMAPFAISKGHFSTVLFRNKGALRKLLEQWNFFGRTQIKIMKK